MFSGEYVHDEKSDKIKGLIIMLNNDKGMPFIVRFQNVKGLKYIDEITFDDMNNNDVFKENIKEFHMKDGEIISEKDYTDKPVFFKIPMYKEGKIKYEFDNNNKFFKLIIIFNDKEVINIYIDKEEAKLYAENDKMIFDTEGYEVLFSHQEEAIIRNNIFKYIQGGELPFSMEIDISLL